MKKADRIVIPSRESLEAKVASIVQLRLEIAELKTRMEKAVARIQARYQVHLTPLLERHDLHETAVEAYCDQHREELFTDKKSLDLLCAVVGFELNPHHVEKVGKAAWPAVATKINQLDFGQDYVREGALEVDKAALIRDRAKLTPEQLRQMGVRIEQLEQFFIRPKAEMADDSAKVAA